MKPKNVIFCVLAGLVFMLSASFAMAAVDQYGNVAVPSLPMSTGIPTTNPILGVISGAVAGGFLAIFVIVLIFIVALYIYTALAHMAIARKSGIDQDWVWLAWIPLANLYLIARIVRKSPWPLWLIITCWIPIVNIVTIIILAVYVLIWQWKMFEKVGRPGWWVLTPLMGVLVLIAGMALSLLKLGGGSYTIAVIAPILYLLSMILYLVLLGVAAWGKSNVQNPSNPSDSMIADNPQNPAEPKRPENFPQKFN